MECQLKITFELLDRRYLLCFKIQQNDASWSCQFCSSGTCFFDFLVFFAINCDFSVSSCSLRHSRGSTNLDLKFFEDWAWKILILTSGKALAYFQNRRNTIDRWPLIIVHANSKAQKSDDCLKKWYLWRKAALLLSYMLCTRIYICDSVFVY